MGDKNFISTADTLLLCQWGLEQAKKEVDADLELLCSSVLSYLVFVLRHRIALVPDEVLHNINLLKDMYE